MLMVKACFYCGDKAYHAIQYNDNGEMNKTCFSKA